VAVVSVVHLVHLVHRHPIHMLLVHRLQYHSNHRNNSHSRLRNNNSRLRILNQPQGLLVMALAQQISDVQGTMFVRRIQETGTLFFASSRTRTAALSRISSVPLASSVSQIQGSNALGRAARDFVSKCF